MRTFHELFVGRDDAYGTYVSSSKSAPAGQKVEGDARTKREPVTKELYDKHLDGEASLGIVPIRIDGTVMWFAIDVDTYDNADLHKNLLKAIQVNKLPLVMTKSKSGGAHLWCFLTEPMQARDAKEVASQYLKILGLPQSTEIFPKQTEVDKQNVGNWINLPYFGNTRLHVYLKGDDFPFESGLDVFLRHANDSLAKPEDISHRHSHDEMEKVEKDGSDAPPCIDSFEINGVPEGGRNEALFHVATYLKRKYPDDWSQRLMDWNLAHCHPPVGGELITITGQHEKTNYQYRCDVSPQCTVCSKKLCRTRKFGIGGGVIDGELPFRVGGIRKINSEEPIYYVDIDGDEIRMNIDELMDYTRVKKLIFKRQDRNIPTVKQQVWDGVLTTLMNSVIIEDAPSIVGETGLTLDLLRRYLDDFCQDESRDQAAEGMPYVDGEKAYFQANDFLKFMSGEVKGVRHERVWSVLKEEAGALEQTFEKDNSHYKLWVIPWRGKPKDGSASF